MKEIERETGGERGKGRGERDGERRDEKAKKKLHRTFINLSCIFVRVSLILYTLSPLLPTRKPSFFFTQPLSLSLPLPLFPDTYMNTPDPPHHTESMNNAALQGINKLFSVTRRNSFQLVTATDMRTAPEELKPDLLWLLLVSSAISHGYR